MIEKRIAPRIPTAIAAAFSAAGDFFVGTIRNISATGVFIETDTVPALDARLALSIRLPDELQVMNIAGRVVWAKAGLPGRPAGLGIEFIDLSAADGRRLERFVAVHAPRQPQAGQSTAGAAQA